MAEYGRDDPENKTGMENTVDSDGESAVKERKPARRKREDESFELFDWADSLVTSLVFIVLLLSLVIKITEVDGDSMQPTLYDTERLIISDLLYTPKQGDVIVISKRNFEKPLVKRVIATEGQTVDIDLGTHTVTVDGKVLTEDYIKEETNILYDVVFPVKVPDGCLFVMGDNRNNSLDSRTKMVGFIDNREVLGRVIVRVFPLGRFGSVQ